MEENVIKVDICFYYGEDGEKVYDEEHMRDEFEEKLLNLLNDK
jgi:hypothetical protein